MSTAVKLFPTLDDIANLKAWFRANDLSTITKNGSDEVEQWNSKASIAVETKQSAGSQKPVWTDAVQNGRASVLFTGANSEFLETDGDIPLLAQNDLGFTFYALVKSLSATTTNGFVFSQNRGGNNLQWSIRQNDNTPDNWAVRGRVITTPSASFTTSAINFQATLRTGSTQRISFSGSPSLGGVGIGDVLRIINAVNPVNNGQKIISAVDDGADTIDYYEPNRTDNTDDETTGSSAINYSGISNNTPDSTGEYGDFPLDTNVHLIMGRQYMGISEPNRDQGLTQIFVDDFGMVKRVNTSTGQYSVIADPLTFLLGDSAAGGAHFNGHLLELAIYDRPHTDLEMGYARHYFNEDYALGWDLLS